MTSPRSVYLEAHSALSAPLLALGLLPPAGALAGLAVALTAGQTWLFGLVGALIAVTLISVGLLYRNWPTGVLVDQRGISIGAVRSRQAARRTPTVNHQSWGLCACPWPAVRSVRVVTDRTELRQMRNQPQFHTLTNRWSGKRGLRYCNIGVLSAPFMRAAVLIEVNPAAVTTSAIRPARFYTNGTDGQFSHLVQPRPSPTWVAPTRHPGKLSAALQALPVHLASGR